MHAFAQQEGNRSIIRFQFNHRSKVNALLRCPSLLLRRRRDRLLELDPLHLDVVVHQLVDVGDDGAALGSGNSMDSGRVSGHFWAHFWARFSELQK